MTTSQPASTATPAPQLCHCGHTDAEHDVVAARYCRATLNEVLRRGCACYPNSPSVRIYDRR